MLCVTLERQETTGGIQYPCSHDYRVACKEKVLIYLPWMWLDSQKCSVQCRKALSSIGGIQYPYSHDYKVMYKVKVLYTYLCCSEILLNGVNNP